MDRESLSAALARCNACALRDGCRAPVYGSGNGGWMLLGEAPGAREDLTGQPFCGPSGKFLTRLLAEAGLSRDDFFVTNTVKCRPPANRTPLRSEQLACRPWLAAQLMLHRPSLVVAVGAVAASTFLGSVKVTGLMGQLIPATLGDWSGMVAPLIHPAYALRFRGKSEGPLVEMKAALLAIAERKEKKQ